MNSSQQNDTLEGRVVLVTGGGSTVCKRQTASMVERGADVIVMGRDAQTTEKCVQELRKVRESARIVGCDGIDLRDRSKVENAVEKALGVLGRIDYVIAGSAGNFLADYHHISSDCFNAIVEVDSIAAVNLVRASLSQLRANNGSVVLVSPLTQQYEVPFAVAASEAASSIRLMNTFTESITSLGVSCDHIVPLSFKLNEPETTKSWFISETEALASSAAIHDHRKFPVQLIANECKTLKL